MSHWSAIPELNQKISDLNSAVNDHDVTLTFKKDISYGTQLTCEKGDISGTVTLYFSKKKGFSAVNNSKNDVTNIVYMTFLNLDRPVIPFRPRIGSDEAGKGDFFGPLTVAAFFIETEEMEQELLTLGIRDSKRLTDKKISAMAQKIRERWPSNCEILSPSVEQYNQLYGTIGNLNLHLGWMHGRVLADMSERFFRGTPIETIVDKFADVKNVTSSVAGLERLSISAITHGEDAELAIAAASVLARDRFVSLMKVMSDSYSVDFPFGASEKVKEIAREFIARYGFDRLNEVAKTHFKTAREL